MKVPEPVIEVAVEPRSSADQERLSAALSQLTEEDPSLRVTFDLQGGQTIIKGMSELHLDIAVDRLRREFDVVLNVGGRWPACSATSAR